MLFDLCFSQDEQPDCQKETRPGAGIEQKGTSLEWPEGGACGETQDEGIPQATATKITARTTGLRPVA